jgi:hypothetical protein
LGDANCITTDFSFPSDALNDNVIRQRHQTTSSNDKAAIAFGRPLFVWAMDWKTTRIVTENRDQRDYSRLMARGIRWFRASE